MNTKYIVTILIVIISIIAIWKLAWAFLPYAIVFAAGYILAKIS